MAHTASDKLTIALRPIIEGAIKAEMTTLTRELIKVTLDMHSLQADTMARLNEIVARLAILESAVASNTASLKRLEANISEHVHTQPPARPTPSNVYGQPMPMFPANIDFH